MKQKTYFCKAQCPAGGVILCCRIKVKVTRCELCCHLKLIDPKIYIPNMNKVPCRDQRLRAGKIRFWTYLQRETDRQAYGPTDRWRDLKLYHPYHSIPGHKKGKKKLITVLFTLWHCQFRCMFLSSSCRLYSSTSSGHHWQTDSYR